MTVSICTSQFFNKADGVQYHPLEARRMISFPSQKTVTMIFPSDSALLILLPWRYNMAPFYWLSLWFRFTKGVSAQIYQHLTHPTCPKTLEQPSCSVISNSLPLPKKRVVHNSSVVMQCLPHISSSTQWMLASLQYKYVHYAVFSWSAALPLAASSIPVSPHTISKSSWMKVCFIIAQCFNHTF